MGFSRQEYWSGFPFPSPGDLPDPGIQPRSPTLEADALTSEPPVYYIFFSVKVSTGYIIFLIDMGIGKWGFQNQLYYWQSFFKIFFKLILFTCSLARYHTACGILAPQPGIWTHAPCIGCADGSPGKSPDRAFGEHGLGMQTIGLLMPDPGVKQISSQITDSFGNPQASPGQSRAFVTKLTAEPKATRSTCVLQVSWSQRAGREASPPPSSSQTHQPDNLLLFSAVEMSGGDGGQKEDKTYIYWCPWTQKYKAWRREINPPLSFSSVAQSCPTLGPHGLQHARLPCPLPSPGVCSNSCPLNRGCHPTFSSSVDEFQ